MPRFAEVLQRWLADADLAGDDEECLMRRVIDSGGRSRAFINGRGVTSRSCARRASTWWIFTASTSTSRCCAPAQRALLDAYAGLGGTAEASPPLAALAGYCRAHSTLLETNAAAFAAEREQLEWQVRELDALKFNPDEWQELLAEHARLAHAQSLIEGAQYAMDALSEGDNSSVTQLAAVSSRLARLLEYDARLKEIVDVIASAQAQAQEAVYMLRDYQQRLDIDPQRFKEVEQRLDAVHTSAQVSRHAGLRPAGNPGARTRAMTFAQGSDVAEVLRSLESERRQRISPRRSSWVPDA